MIDYFEPEIFIREAVSGRTKPILLASYSTGADKEVFCKLSVGCDDGVTSLAKEVISACVAADLSLPIPKPYLVELSDDFIQSVPDITHRARMTASDRIAYGSSRVPNQFSNWIDGTAIPNAMLQQAAEVFFFDAVIQNFDRQCANPNCLVRGDELRILDHEVAFSHGLILGWTPPWRMDGMSAISAPGRHIFSAGLRGRAVDVNQIKARWSGLSEDRLAEYQSCIPPSWAASATAVTQAIQLVRDARENIDDCVEEFLRVLS